MMLFKARLMIFVALAAILVLILELRDGPLNLESVDSSYAAVKRLRLGKCMMHWAPKEF